MSIITLTSDWGYGSPYAGAVKGAILGKKADASIVDITHGIEPFNIRQTGFTLAYAYQSFPKGSIHIIGVETEASSKTPHTIIQADGHYFIGADTGVFSLIADKAEKIIHLDIYSDSHYYTFSSRDVFATAAVHILEGNSIDDLGDAADSVKSFIKPASVVEDTLIKGRVIYVDDYGNLFTNITEEQIKKHVDRKPFVIQAMRSYSIKVIHKAYSDVGEADLVAVVGSSGYLEIAINKGNAAQLLNISLDDPVDLFIEPQSESGKAPDLFGGIM